MAWNAACGEGLTWSSFPTKAKLIARVRRWYDKERERQAGRPGFLARPLSTESMYEAAHRETNRTQRFHLCLMLSRYIWERKGNLGLAGP